LKSEIKLKASIDLGTTKVSVMIGEVIGDHVRVIGVGVAPAEGLRQGVVVDIDQVAAVIERVSREAEQMAGLKAKTFNVGAAGEHIRSMNSRGVVSIPSLEECITEEDVSRCIRAASKFSLPSDREIIHTLPQEYIVDNQRGIRQPAGMYGARLEARVHVVTASQPALDNVAKALELANADLGEIVLEPLASSYSVLAPDEREMGVILLDIGGGTTDVMVYVDGGVVASGVIGLGGNNITSDIAYGLRTSMQYAEDIKIAHGCAITTMVAGEESIEVSNIATNEKRQVSRQVLAGIIEPRVEELLSLIDRQVTASGFKSSLGAGVVLTGGSAMLTGICDLAEQVFHLPVRLGMPRDIGGLSEVVNHPRFATGLGLLRAESVECVTGDIRTVSTRKLMHSFNQLKRAIANFI